MEKMISGIVRRLKVLENDIVSKMIGEIVMESLARIDTVAYVRFASVYKNFQAADDFDKFVSELRPATGEEEKRPVSDDLGSCRWLWRYRRGLGRTWPNPSVGCVIVAGGRVVGRGRIYGGRPHAEVLALQQAGSLARGATACNLGAMFPYWANAPMQ